MGSEITDRQLAACAELVSRRRAKRSLIASCVHFDHRYTPSRTGFHAKLARALEDVEAGKIKQLIISTPPQHGKSRLAAQEFVTWYLGRNPTKRVVSTAYAAGRAENNGMVCRNRVSDPRYRLLWGTGLSESRIRIGNAVRRMNEWYLDNGIGGVKAVGVGGGITGFPADLILCDDLFSGWQDAHSPVIRQRVWEWFMADLMTRKSEGAPVIIIMTRWHPDDIVGRLLDPKWQEEMRMTGGDAHWEVLNLRGLARADDPLGREPGTALFPEMKSADFVRSQMAVLGPYLASALYDGDPVAKGGNYIDPDDFQIISRDEVPAGLRWVRGWDLGATEAKEVLKNDPDYTFGIAGAHGPGGELYLRDGVFGQWAWPKARSHIVATARCEYGVEVGVEAVAGFKTAFANLKEVMPPNVMLTEVGVDADKVTRALPWAALAANKKVFVVAGEWVQEFKRQAQAFPGGTHDDGVDAVSVVHEMLRKRAASGAVGTASRQRTERDADYGGGMHDGAGRTERSVAF